MRKNCFCARERDSSTAEAIFWDTSIIAACLVKICEVRVNMAVLGDGVNNTAVKKNEQDTSVQGGTTYPTYSYNH